MLQGDELARRPGPAAGILAHVVDPADHPLIEIAVDAHGVIDLLPPLDQAWQDVVDVADGKGIVGAVNAYCPLLAGSGTVPDLARRVALAAELDVLPLAPARNQHQHGLRLGKAGEVVKIAVLTVGVKRVAVARS